MSAVRLLWSKKALMVYYVIGYWGYLAAAGAHAWPRLGIWDWITYMEWQFLYALIWPVWIAV